MLNLSTFKKNRLRSLGVEADLSQVTVYRRPGEDFQHLLAECGGEVEVLTALDLSLAPWCNQCGRDTPARAKRSALLSDLLSDERALYDLDGLLEAVSLLEMTCEMNSPGASPDGPSSRALLGVVVDSVAYEATLEARLARAAADLLAEVRTARSRAVELLRSEAGEAAVTSELQGRNLAVDRHFDVLFVQRSGLGREDAARVLVYGEELSPDRFLVRGPRPVVEHLAALGRSSTLLANSRGAALEVLTTASALWEPGGTGPLSKGKSLLEAAAALTPAGC